MKSQKSDWRIRVEQHIKDGKSNMEIFALEGNPYAAKETFRCKMTLYRRQLKKIANLPDKDRSVLERETERAGIPIENVNYFWYKSKKISINATNDKTVEELLFDNMAVMRQYAPVYPVISRRPINSGTCLVIDPADIHIGKLARISEVGEDYNVEIAVSRVMEGIKGLMSLTANFGIDKIILTIGGDIMHTDNKRRTTTNGTPQDTEGMWYDQFNFARKLYVEIIEALMSVADVHVIHNMSNHDNVMGWCLAQTIEAWFIKCANVTFDVSPNPRKAFLWHDNLIVFTHGEGNEDRLALSIPHEFPKEWSQSKFRNVYKQHIHHKTSKDHMSITIETSRSVSGTDSWHMAQMYSHAPKAVECYLHAKGKGQFGRFSHYF